MANLFFNFSSITEQIVKVKTGTERGQEEVRLSFAHVSGVPWLVTKSSALLSRPHSSTATQTPRLLHLCSPALSIESQGTKTTTMASSACLLQASTAFAPRFSLPSRPQPPLHLRLRGSPNRRRGISLTAISAASPEVEKESSPSSSPQESLSVSTHRGCIALVALLSAIELEYVVSIRKKKKKKSNLLG